MRHSRRLTPLARIALLATCVTAVGALYAVHTAQFLSFVGQVNPGDNFGPLLLAGGTFDYMDGQPSKNLSSIDIASGRYQPGLPETNGPVHALLVPT